MTKNKSILFACVMMLFYTTFLHAADFQAPEEHDYIIKNFHFHSR